MNWRTSLLGFVFIGFLASACGDKQPASIPSSNSRFQQLTASQTGIDFENRLRYDKDFNIFTYRNFYNGGGVAAGDLNGDGLEDLYFTANMGPNRLYINEGNFRFRELKAAQGERSWSTGVSLADVNGDGKLDIYVCNSGDVKGDNKANELFINQGNDENGNPVFEEKAADYNLDDRGFSTHAAFFDYDRDGDLDCYVLNNSYRAIGSFDLKRNERQKRDPDGGDRLYRNDNGRFVDVSEEAGMYGSVIGFGLGVTVGDINRDGWQDIFISNDFFERDYLYLNNQDGTFREVLPKAMKSVSAASMGADMADINNDGWAEIFVTDMLPEPDERIKQVTTFDDWNRYQLLLDADYYHQFTRNMLHLNQGMVEGDETPVFSEVSRYAGVEATDWSWGALLFDMDLDGRKDLFVANGIYQDLTDLDYLNFIAADETKRAAVSGGEVDYRKLIDPMPSVPVPNYAYHNVAGEDGIPRFENVAKEWGLAQPSFSNGSCYADLDNDGDLDLVINNVNMEAFVYRNQSRQLNPEHHYLRIALKGKIGNTQALGTQLMAWAGGKLHMLEQMPVRGFQSTMDERPLFGLGKNDKVDSLHIRWPDGTMATAYDLPVDTTLQFDWGKSSPSFLARALRPGQENAQELLKKTGAIGLNFIHKENPFVDFNRDRMTYNMRSSEGPAMCKGDFNGDGREDLFIGGAKDSPGALFIQNKNDTFSQKEQAAFDKDKASEDTGCACFDADGDGDTDLYVTSGGNEFPTSSSSLGDRLYINDGRGVFNRKDDQILPAGNYESTRAVAAADYDQDGDTDLLSAFVWCRFCLVRPEMVICFKNDGKGNFTVVDLPELQGLGLTTAASWADLDGDKDQDLSLWWENGWLRRFLSMKREVWAKQIQAWKS
ncbi:MAG: VCBS repeat-containing protein [Bacteroidia bacterium]